MTHVERMRRRGILREGTPETGFHWRRADGRPVSDEDLARARALAIPPAWTDVAVSASATTALQAVGTDAAGRTQYRYGERHERRRDARKYRRMLRFAAALPRMRRRANADLRLPGLPRDKVMAAIVRVLSAAFLRPGSRVYARDNGSFGVVTARKRHVSAAGDVVVFDFPGKSGKRQRRALRDADVARVVRRCLALPGAQLFQYRGADGVVVRARRRAVNDYIKRSMGEAFSAKDFRTWAGTSLCASALARLHEGAKPARGERRRRRIVAAAVRATARKLGNTPAVCRASYVAPVVLDEFRKRGRLAPPADAPETPRRRTVRLSDSELAVVALLQRRLRGA